MENLKITTAILISLTLLLIMVLLHSFNENLFIRNARDAITQVNHRVISVERIDEHEQAYRIINLDENPTRFENALLIPFKDILLPENRKRLSALQEDIFLYSQKTPIAAKAWVILNQLDFQRVFILSENASPEVLKYEFQPDTTIRLESN